MNTMKAKVNSRLLAKANRLFTGTLEGRIIEILQNARRAGATKVEITNHDGYVTIRDNGRGIEDFATLLDLGGSGWEQTLETSEDPAGVGLFCLSPREVTIRSNDKMAVISGDGWTGAPVEIRDDPEPVRGTLLRFQDEEWTSEAVDPNAVFCGMQVTVDGKACPNAAFTSDQAALHTELGCRIEARDSQDLDPWHRSCNRGSFRTDNVVVNFHGQVISFDFHPVSEHHLHFLVDMTGEATGIRMMLPARTCLIQNEAFEKLKAAIELEAYRYVERRGNHRLPFKEYLRAKDLGITLPEAKPTYSLGLLTAGDLPDPVEVTAPKDFPLARCYRFDPDFEGGQETDEANVHLLAALGTFKEPFMPVNIHTQYDGYSWAKLPRIGKVELSIGKKLHQEWLWSGTLTCVDALTITAHASDDRIFSLKVCMAISLQPAEGGPTWATEHVLVTPDAPKRLSASEIWYHFGGWCDDGDTYDTQEWSFSKELERFWARLVGPDEHLRRQILDILHTIPAWRRVIVHADGRVQIQFPNTPEKLLRPPSNGSLQS